MNRMLSIYLIAFITALMGSTAFANDTGHFTSGQTARVNGSEVRGNKGTLDAPGEILRTIQAPIWHAGSAGTALAVDCNGNLYYRATLDWQCSQGPSSCVVKMDASGNFLESFWITGNGVPFTAFHPTEFCWDECSGGLWAVSGNLAMFASPSLGGAYRRFIDTHIAQGVTMHGIALDADGPTGAGSLWVFKGWEPDGRLTRYDIDPLALNPLLPAPVIQEMTPLDANGDEYPTENVGGICVGNNNSMLISRPQSDCITRHDKTTGQLLATYILPAGTNPTGIECDVVNFAPRTVVWCKSGTTSSTFLAVEIEDGSCACSSVPSRFTDFTEADYGDLPACDYPTLTGNPGHLLSNIAWLGTAVTADAAPNYGDADGADDGVEYLDLPWTPCELERVRVVVSVGTRWTFDYGSWNCRGLYLNGWKDGNLDGDFCDDFECGGQIASEWIVQNLVPRVFLPGNEITILDPGVFDIGPYDGVFRWRLTSHPLDRYGFGLADQALCAGMTCGSHDMDFLGEVEDYIIHDAQLDVELLSFEALAGADDVTLTWVTASESDNDYFELVRDGSVIAQIPTQGNSTTGLTYSHVDRNVVVGTTYSYSLFAIDRNGNRRSLGTQSATPDGVIGVVGEYALHQNYPNPFNPATEIAFDLAEAGHVTLTVYNLAGQEVARLADGRLSAGHHNLTFDASIVSSGIYLYRIRAGQFTAQKKMVLIR